MQRATSAIRPVATFEPFTGKLVDRAASVLAMVAVVAAAGITSAQQQAVDNERPAPSLSAGKPVDPSMLASGIRAHTTVAGYFGAPWTYPSDIRFTNPAGKTDFTLEHVGWDAKPFKSPIYYGVRVQRWAPGDRVGTMVDFTHSKTITRPDEEVAIKGLIEGAPAPAKAKIGALFKHLEFSHGHNMLTLNGLYRLASLAPRLSPYVGLGVGISLPHTEVERIGETPRTYEYQYAGPAAQALIGFEVRLPTTSLFVEYKFTFADYRAPLSRLEGGWLFGDLWRQATLWWSGQTPPGGYVETKLLSHQIIGGAGVRF
jgi:lipid A oxidase